VWPRRLVALVATGVAMMLVAPVLASGAGPGGTQPCQGCSSPPVFTAAQVKKAVDSAYKAFSSVHKVSGMAIAVVSPAGGAGLTTNTYEFGYANQTADTPVTANTQFEIGSETKLFTAALFARAIARHLVTGTEPVLRLPPYPAVPDPSDCNVPRPNGGSLDAHPMTLVDLATHRAGLSDDPSNFPHSSTGHSTYTQTDLFKALSTARLLFCPGTDWSYSDFGFGLLGTLLATREGESYGTLVRQQITRPLGMTETGLEPATPPVKLAIPYKSASVEGFYWDNTAAMAGGGGLISSITDMATFVRAQLGEGPAAVVHALDMTQKAVAPGTIGDSYFRMGLGWQVYSPETGIAGDYLVKNGGTDGMASVTVLLPSESFGVTVLSNDTSAPNRLGEAIVQKLYGTPVPHF
jgi:D-alanyl-D-alanine-carboxypeptidase/D-alanyl-D-alanine-endopeptidase